MSRQQHHCTTCVNKPCTKGTCGAWFVQCPRPPPRTCAQRLYDIYTYTYVAEKEFNITINARYLPIQGFILAFVDECGQPIIFDNCNSFMKIEAITPFPAENCFQYPPTYNYYIGEICPFADKNYYTYTIQEHNCMPLNTALWSYYINLNVPLKLSFKLNYNYTGGVFLYINMFYRQKQQCLYNLNEVIHNSIYSDQEDGCIENPYACGYVSWMTHLQETSEHTPSSNDDYPYNY